MTQPVQDKTWQIAANLQSYLDTDSAEQTNKGLLLLIKNTLIGFGSSPWIVESSCDSVNVENNNQVDRWLDTGDVVHGVGAHSWIVLQSPGSQTVHSFCFDASDATASMPNATIVWSPEAGFGASNGGTDGTTNARPTATDEIVLISNVQWGPGETFFQQSVLHVWHSSDGEVTRVVMMHERQCEAYWDFSSPKNPKPTWEPHAIASVVHNALGCCTYQVMNDLFTAWDFRDANIGAAGNFGIGTIGTLSAGVLERTGGRIAHAANGELQFVPPILASITATLRGMWGTMYDWHWASDAIRTGEIVFNDTDAWVCIDHIWLPWTLDTKFLVA